MKRNISRQSIYVWTCVIITFTIHTSLVHSRPSLTKPSVSDVSSSSFTQEQTTRASSADTHGQTTRASSVHTQGQTTRAGSVHTQEQTTKTLLEKETENIVVWQLHPSVNSENDGDSNSSINLLANSNTEDCYGDRDERRADCSTEENLDDSIDKDRKDYKNYINDSNVSYNSDVKVDYKDDNGGNSNSNNSNNNSSSNNNNDNLEELKTFNCSSKGYRFTNDFNCVYFHSINSSNTTRYNDKNNDHFHLHHKEDNNDNITTIQNLDNATCSNNKTNNQTNVCTTIMTRTETELLTDLEEIYYALQWYTYIVIQPILGLLGLTGNVLSGIVATRQGLNKATNVFILSLAVADSFTLIRWINWASLVRFFPVHVAWYNLVWEYPPLLTYFCYILTILIDYVLILSGSIISGYICTMIAIERVLAVCLPFHCKTIITPRRAWIFTICTFLFWIFVLVWSAVMTSGLNMYYDPSLDIYISRYYKKENSLDNYIDYYFVIPISKILPVVVTVVGSIIIGVKVKVARRKRKGMTNLSMDKTSESRTTKTLMLVCGAFVVTQCAILPGYVFYYLVEERLYQYIFSHFTSIIQSVNASTNFILYVVFNKKFRAELRLLFSCCSKARGGNTGTTKCITKTSQVRCIT